MPAGKIAALSRSPSIERIRIDFEKRFFQGDFFNTHVRCVSRTFSREKVEPSVNSSAPERRLETNENLSSGGGGGPTYLDDMRNLVGQFHAGPLSRCPFYYHRSYTRHLKLK